MTISITPASPGSAAQGGTRGSGAATGQRDQRTGAAVLANDLVRIAIGSLSSTC